MKRALVFFFAFSLTFYASAKTKKEHLSEIATQAMREFNTPALTAAIVDKGQIVWQEALGFTDLESIPPRKAAINDVFRIASISKSMAATIILTLVAENKVGLNDPVHKYLPDYPKDKKDITIRHLLNHTSGMRHYQYQLLEKENTKAYKDLKEGLTINNVDKSPLEFKPGTAYRYSSYGYNLLGAIIEAVLKKPYEEIIQERIFNKAQMAQSFLDNNQRIIPGRVKQYRHGENGGFINAPYVDSSYKWSAGGVLSNVFDLLKFHDAWINNKFFPKEIRQLAETATVLSDNKTIQYGLGWVVFSVNNRDYVGHSGTATGGRSYLLRLKDQDVAVALLINVEKADRIKERAIELMETWLKK